MRIGIFTDTYPPYINGVSTSVLMLQRALEKKGHTVYIVSVNSDALKYSEEDNNKILRIPGIPIGIYDYRLTGIYPLKAINIIKEWNLDVIHSQTEFGVGTFARIIAKQYNIPLVHTYHTMYEDYVHYITKGYFTGSAKKVVEYLTKFYCDKTITELIVPTKKAYDLFKDKYKVERSVHIIPTGFELERFADEGVDSKKVELIKQGLGIQPDDFVIVTVGRMGTEKNVDFLIDGTIQIIKKHPNCKLILIGDGPDIDKFKDHASKYPDNIIFTGKVPWEEIPTYYRVANVFTTASVTETQGLTVIEALASSLPVVVIDDESFKAMAINDLNGLEFKTKKDYKHCMEKLMNDQVLYERLKSQAAISVKQYDSKYFAERVLDVYNLAIGPKNETKKKKTFLSNLVNVFKGGINGK